MNPLFAEFAPSNKEEWIRHAEKELKGEEYAKRLVKTGWEGFPIEPIFFPADAEKSRSEAGIPGFAPFIRGYEASGYRTGNWVTSQEISVLDPVAANGEAHRAIEAAGSQLRLCFAHVADLDDEQAWARMENGVAVLSLHDLETVLEGVDLSKVSLHLTGANGTVLPLLALAALVQKKSLPKDAIHGTVGVNPFQNLLLNGAFPVPEEKLSEYLAAAVRFSENFFPNISIVLVDGGQIHNAGGSVVQETAAMLAMGAEYLQRLTDEGLEPEQAARAVHFRLETGVEFFTEIARLRAFRMLWANVLEAYEAGLSERAQPHIHAATSRWRHTTFDPYVNILRGTVESMAAILGGTGSLSIAPLDAAAGNGSPQAKRLARNTSVILREESYLDKVIDPAGGSWYVEWLTDTIAKEAWTLFQQIEQAGGFTVAFKAGMLQSLVGAVAEKKTAAISQRKEILLGTNQHPNLAEQPLPTSDATGERAAAKKRYQDYLATRGKVLSPGQAAMANGGFEGIFTSVAEMLVDKATIFEIHKKFSPPPTKEIGMPLRQVHADGAFVRLRKAVETFPKRPTAFLATLGPVVWRRARATFAMNFFGTAGIPSLDHSGYDSVEEAADAAIAVKPEIIVLCSEDAEYSIIAAPFIERVKQKLPTALFVVAGNPKEQIEALKAAGVDECIHVKSDAAKTLESILRKLGVALGGNE